MATLRRLAARVALAVYFLMMLLTQTTLLYSSPTTATFSPFGALARALAPATPPAVALEELDSHPPSSTRSFELPVPIYKVTRNRDGQACVGNWMCQSGVCGRFGMGFCAPSCTRENHNCPVGYTCTAVNGSNRCVRKRTTFRLGGSCSRNAQCSTENCSPSSATCVCTPPTQRCGQRCYMPFVRNETWSGAVTTCLIGGGILAVPRSEDESKCLAQVIRLTDVPEFWIGYRRLSDAAADAFIGEDGWPMSWSNWGRDGDNQQPDGVDDSGTSNTISDLCASTENTESEDNESLHAQWSDRFCNATIPFVCQFG